MKAHNSYYTQDIAIIWHYIPNYQSLGKRSYTFGIQLSYLYCRIYDILPKNWRNIKNNDIKKLVKLHDVPELFYVSENLVFKLQVRSNVLWQINKLGDKIYWHHELGCSQLF